MLISYKHDLAFDLWDNLLTLPLSPSLGERGLNSKRFNAFV
jgi:hypothetical protein